MWPEPTYEELKKMMRELGGGLRPGSPEWRAAWKGLARLTGDRDREAFCPLTHESWEYFSSFRDRGRWTHEFRHRHHPVKQRRWYVHVPASAEWTPQAETPRPRLH
jgi:hypothetical protein